MEVVDIKEKWPNQIRTVTIGATAEEGGTRGSTVTVGGETTLPFLTFEGEIPKGAYSQSGNEDSNETGSGKAGFEKRNDFLGKTHRR